MSIDRAWNLIRHLPDDAASVRVDGVRPRLEQLVDVRTRMLIDLVDIGNQRWLTRHTREELRYQVPARLVEWPDREKPKPRRSTRAEIAAFFKGAIRHDNGGDG